MFEIAKMLVLSTAHLTERTAQLFGEIVRDFEGCRTFGSPGGEDLSQVSGLSIYPKDDFGWFLPLGDFIDDHTIRACLAVELLPIFDKAAELGCDWLMFDRDADPIHDLKTYDW